MITVWGACLSSRHGLGHNIDLGNRSTAVDAQHLALTYLADHHHLDGSHIWTDHGSHRHLLLDSYRQPVTIPWRGQPMQVVVAEIDVPGRPS